MASTKRRSPPPGYEIALGGASEEGDYPGGSGWFFIPCAVPNVFYKTKREAIDAAWIDNNGDFCRACGASIPPREGEGTCPECVS